MLRPEGQSCLQTASPDLLPCLIFISPPSHIPSYLYLRSAGVKGVWLPNNGIKGVSHHHLALFLF
ncbi:hypothetical protein I79_014193 [Cricetulus griseus]|uniref:Uncharacterized protein n=1 Tax=Cricetulus griseus TaxID=10029 RepID=G3HTG8_CRIGR|nr:hypothetical protein I79_014193 [Cricetulus griseus]